MNNKLQNTLPLVTPHLSTSDKYYSLDTCCLVPIEQNVKEMQARTSPYFKATSPSGKEFISNCQMDFVRIYNLTRCGINGTLRGKQKTHRGWKFQYI